jgi:hypothetical protein
VLWSIWFWRAVGAWGRWANADSRGGTESVGLFGRSISSPALRGSVALPVFRSCRLGFHLFELGDRSPFFPRLFLVGFSNLCWGSCAPCDADFVRHVPFVFRLFPF